MCDSATVATANRTGPGRHRCFRLREVDGLGSRRRLANRVGRWHSSSSTGATRIAGVAVGLATGSIARATHRQQGSRTRPAGPVRLLRPPRQPQTVARDGRKVRVQPACYGCLAWGSQRLGLQPPSERPDPGRQGATRRSRLQSSQAGQAGGRVHHRPDRSPPPQRPSRDGLLRRLAWRP